MAIGIGGVGCTFLQGGIQDLKEEVRSWRTPGIDGYGAQKLGLGDSSFEFRATLYDSVANTEAWVRSLENLQGSVVGAEDDFGLTYSNLLVQEVFYQARTPAFTTTTVRYRCVVVLRGVVVGDLT